MVLWEKPQGKSYVGRERGGRGGLARVAALFFPESYELVVRRVRHHLQLLVGPRVHGHGPHEGDVHAHAAVRAGAFQTHEGPISDRRPLRVVRAAVDALVVARQYSNLGLHGRRHGDGHFLSVVSGRRRRRGARLRRVAARARRG